jgi:hypothetical protein
MPIHKNVHFISREEYEKYQQPAYSIDTKALAEFKKDIEDDGDIKKVSLDPRVPDKAPTSLE